MKLVILFVTLIASSSLAGLAPMVSIPHGPTDYTEWYSINLVGPVKNKCIIVREGNVCSLFAPDGICCLKERKR